VTTDRRIALVSGGPAAGKTTLAGPLAADLGFALIAKDAIKETLFDAMGGASGDLGQSRLFGAAAMETMWALAAHAPRAVLEANFRPRSVYERDRIIGLGARLVEVYCACPSDEAAHRFAARAAAGTHPAHFWTSLPAGHHAEFDIPVGLGPVITVDATKPVAIGPLADAVRAAFADARPFPS
jgi:predicted kinase